VHFFIAVLGSGLTSNFETVRVEIVDCPDLTKEPFTLACKGKFRPILLHIYFLICISHRWYITFTHTFQMHNFTGHS
jgi:hypothetical protein